MIAHLPRCLALDPTGRYACNCGADAQNALARRLDALPTIAPRIEYDHGPDGETYRIEVPAAPPPPATPLRAVARMLRRLAASACHHDAARHLLASAAAAVELATGLSPEEAIRVLDEVEPPAADDANVPTR